MRAMKGLLSSLVFCLAFYNSVFHEVTGDEHSNSSGIWQSEESKIGLLMGRLSANDHVIVQLERQLIRIKKKLRKRTNDARHIYSRIETTVTRLEGNGCGDKEFQCGSEGRHGKHCISELFVCDGYQDCLNGQDEDPAYCDVSEIRAGMTFSGNFSDGGCFSASPDSYVCRMVVTSVGRSKVHPSVLRVELNWRCNVTVGGQASGKKTYIADYPVAGTYQIANRRLRTWDNDYTDDCYFTDNTFRAMWCQTKLGQAALCLRNVFIARED